MPSSRKRKQAAIRYLVEAMAEGVVAAQSQAGELFGRAGLQARVVAAGAGAEFVDVAKARIERLIVSERCEAAIANRLVAVQLDLVRLLNSARPNVVDAERAARAEFALEPQTPFAGSTASSACRWETC